MATRSPGVCAVAFILWIALASVGAGANAAGKVEASKVDYKGWAASWMLRNKTCELMIVPAVSRVMSFRLLDGPNLLWEDPNFTGKTFPTDPREWKNIGGEKLWPTQQDLFGRFTGGGQNWPPPWPWDAGPSTAEAIPGGVRLTLPHDARFGAHAVREFTLDGERPIVHVRQWIEKTAGEPAPMTLWTIAQVNDPALAFVPATDGEYADFGTPSPQIKVGRDHVALGRERSRGLKIGIASRGQNGYVAALFHASGDEPAAMLVQSHRLAADADYPDKGLQAELYTSSIEFARYTELELLSPLVTLKKGERMRDDAVWQIVQIKDVEPAKAAAEAHRAALDQLAARSEP